MSVTAIVLVQMKKIIRTFRSSGATAPNRAAIPSELGLRRSMIFYRLVRQGVLVQVGDERYYLDELREEVIRKRRQRIVFLMIVLLLAGLAVAMIMQKQ